MNGKKAKQLRKAVEKIYQDRRKSYVQQMLDKAKNLNFPLISKENVKDLPMVRKHYQIAKKVYRDKGV